MKKSIEEMKKSREQMEGLRKVAIAKYKSCDEKLRALAREFFNSLDQDDDGQVDINEFMGFMKENGYGAMNETRLFKMLDMDENGTLDFFEVLTLYYIIQSGRPFCNFCNKFIPETFFSCVDCFENPTATKFSLCVHCYNNKEWNIHYNGRHQFLDNYALLEYRRNSSAKNENHTVIQSELSNLQLSRPLKATTSGPSTAEVHTHNYTTHNYNYTVNQNYNPTVNQTAPTSTSTHSTSTAVIKKKKGASDVLKSAAKICLEIGLPAVASYCSIM